MKLAILVLVPACGVVDEHFTPLPPDATPPPDAPADIAPVVVHGPWSVPRRIDELSLAGFVDQYPSVRGDGLELYFASNRDGNTQDIYVSTRGAPNQPWGAPAYVAELEGGSTETGPDISDDGLTLYFSRAVGGTGTGLDIYVATRASTTGAWGAPVLVSELATADTEISPHVTADGLTMYFTRGASTLDIYTANRPTMTSPWRNIRPVNRFNSAGDDNDVTTPADASEAIFETDRDGALALYTSARTSEGTFALPKPIAELAGGFRADVTADGRSMVLTMRGPDGSTDLYEAARD